MILYLPVHFYAAYNTLHIFGKKTQKNYNWLIFIGLTENCNKVLGDSVFLLEGIHCLE